MVMTAADVVFAPAGRLTAYPVVTDTIPILILICEVHIPPASTATV